VYDIKNPKHLNKKAFSLHVSKRKEITYILRTSKMIKKDQNGPKNVRVWQLYVAAWWYLSQEFANKV